jgi:hypothetical protein
MNSLFSPLPPGNVVSTFTNSPKSTLSASCFLDLPVSADCSIIKIRDDFTVNHFAQKMEDQTLTYHGMAEVTFTDKLPYTDPPHITGSFTTASMAPESKITIAATIISTSVAGVKSTATKEMIVATTGMPASSEASAASSSAGNVSAASVKVSSVGAPKITALVGGIGIVVAAAVAL